MPKSAAARFFDVSLSSIKHCVRKANQRASLKLGKGGGRPPKVHKTTEKLLGEYVHKHPAATVPERYHLLEQPQRWS